jgi:hypothetical protein
VTQNTDAISVRGIYVLFPVSREKRDEYDICFYVPVT